MNNKFPNRPEQHEIDSQGSSLLAYLLPNDFIYRTLGGRDYGIDGIIEFTPGGNVMGIFMSMQLKSTKNIHWTENDTTRVSIRKSTCNYWMQNIMPCLLFLADVSQKKVYYIDVKSQIRQRYSEFLNCDNFSFIMDKRYSLYVTSENDVTNKEYLKLLANFLCVVFTVINYETFRSTITDFIRNWINYFDHIKHQGADPFLIQEITFYNTTQHIYKLMLHIAEVLNLEYNKVDFIKVRERYLEAYKFYKVLPEYEILEMEITEIHYQMQQNIPAIIEGIKKYILNLERDYWLNQFPYEYQETIKMEWIYES